MIRYNPFEFKSALSEIGIKKDDIVIVHNSLMNFGLPLNINPADLSKVIFDSLMELIGEGGTIAVPTFNFDFCKGLAFDRQRSPSKVMGVFSEYVRTLPGSKRSLHPMESIAVTGKLRDEIIENDTLSSFSDNGPFDKLLKYNAKILLLGATINAVSMIHLAEEKFNVPYRYWKSFRGEIIDNNASSIREYKMFVRDMDFDPTLNISSIAIKLKEQNKIKEKEVGAGTLKLFYAKDFISIAEAAIAKNPYFYITNHPKILTGMKKEMEEYFDRLWPLNRSLTGNGNRETLKILSEIVDLEISEVPSGTPCFDWIVPPEWNVKEAWIKDSKGNIIVDFAVNNLHLLGYSAPVKKTTMTFAELKPHLYTLPKQPDLIPYLISYYERRWGFCLSHEQFLKLDQNDTYELVIDSSFNDNGSMTVAEAVIKGSSDREVFFSTYFCHPSMANNELSGPLVTSFIYSKLKEKKNLKYNYRFIFIPETISAIYMLSKRGEHFKQKLDAGYVLTCIGDAGKFTYKRSRIGNALPDRAAEAVLRQTEDDFNLVDYFPAGSDERQYCSPGFNLPVGSMIRTMYGRYPEYHTSGDNKSIISFEAMEKAVEKYLEIVEVLEKNEKYVNLKPYGEPHMGKTGLYPTLAEKKSTQFVDAMMWILNLADGTNDLISISERSKFPLKELIPIVDKLLEKGILRV